MVSKGMENVIKLLKNNANTVMEKRVEESRKGLDVIASITKLPKDVKIEPIDINGIAAIWISVPTSNPDNIILYLHGGGYISGSFISHQDLAMRISRAAKAKVL
ncbi:MAG: alpha/beta hydrolase fold domain-containing protein, partial [Candidatus Lokiarchaeota archaeon]|nr:alpha/beta hydrolase fold domain-containing protein [Candidatus Lokiarchaeota archaeon]